MLINFQKLNTQKSTAFWIQIVGIWLYLTLYSTFAWINWKSGCGTRLLSYFIREGTGMLLLHVHPSNTPDNLLREEATIENIVIAIVAFCARISFEIQLDLDVHCKETMSKHGKTILFFGIQLNCTYAWVNLSWRLGDAFVKNVKIKKHGFLIYSRFVCWLRTAYFRKSFGSDFQTVHNQKYNLSFFSLFHSFKLHWHKYFCFGLLCFRNINLI